MSVLSLFCIESILCLHGGIQLWSVMCLTVCVLYLQYMTEASWNFRMMKYIFTELHVYDEEKNYIPFDWEKEEPFYAIQRKVLPNTM